MQLRRLLRNVPGVSRFVKILDRMEHDHLELVAAHQSLERSYQKVADDYHALARSYTKLQDEHSAFRATMQRLLAPPLQSSNQAASAEPSLVNGVPIPPPILRYWVANDDDLEWFLTTGQLGMQALNDILATHDMQLATFSRILDFGCGCARVLRHLPAVTAAALDGTDSNSAAIAWCREQLQFAQFAVNMLEPPLAYPDQTFDLIYAFSVFTHLPAEAQRNWIKELHRCLKPGGYLIMSTHGSYYLSHMTEEEQRASKAGALIVHHQERYGENVCSAFHSEAAVRNLVEELFAVVSFLPQGPKGNPYQDLFLLRVK